jgi:undecaprenyl diphosphate synthase
MSSALLEVPEHVAIIMDGNGRWATRRGHPRPVGHLAGARATRRVVTAAARAGVRTLTLYAFSADNWRRPAAEVDALMALFARYLATEADRCTRDGVRLQVIGRRDRLSRLLRETIEHAEQRTAHGDLLRVRIAIDYSAREAMLTAARALETTAATHEGAIGREATGADAQPTGSDREAFAAALARALHDPEPVRDVDLLIRSGGELRLSDFLLWECAYAELWFTDVFWPDFSARHLRDALAAFARRQRRFGAVAPSTDLATAAA